MSAAIILDISLQECVHYPVIWGTEMVIHASDVVVPPNRSNISRLLIIICCTILSMNTYLYHCPCWLWLIPLCSYELMWNTSGELSCNVKRAVELILGRDMKLMFQAYLHTRTRSREPYTAYSYIIRSYMPTHSLMHWRGLDPELLSIVLTTTAALPACGWLRMSGNSKTACLLAFTKLLKTVLL